MYRQRPKAKVNKGSPELIPPAGSRGRSIGELEHTGLGLVFIDIQQNSRTQSHSSSFVNLHQVPSVIAT